MGRAPCCEKTGLKKGPWSPEEDRILISYVQQHGHANWRALPKQAGLLRCGKSCRLRWINYLRPDIKRGNFTEEEEESIIQLHETLGNRWSAIAARLPGRTDNEIKNVWHTHLKKRLDKRNQDKSNDIKDRKQSTNTLTKCDSNNSIVTTTSSNSNTTTTQSESENSSNNFPPRPTSSNLSSISSPRPSSSEVSSLGNSSGDMTINHSDVKSERIDNYNGENSVENSFLEIDDTFWSEALSAENAVTSLTSKETNEMDMILGNLPEIDQSFWSDELSSSSTVENNNCSSSMPLDFGGVNFAGQLQTESPPFISIDDYMVEPSLVHGGSDYPQVGDDNGMDFWYDVFVNSSGESIQPLF